MNQPEETPTGPIAWLLIQPIRFYQRFISRYTPATCRYHPTCSTYGVQALRRHGAIKGTILTIWRVLRCNPWSSGGIDHVPEKGRWRGRRDVVREDEDHGSAGGSAEATVTNRFRGTGPGSPAPPCTSHTGSCAA